MGAQQSSGRGQGEDPSQPVKTCYYELLGVQRDATDDEIKKSYRRRALELHPDRNLNDVQNATRRFAEIQAAYEVLSDPQERSWYDSHREAILRGADPDSDDRNPEYNDVKLTSTDDIFSLIRRFNSTVPFTDEPSGFFGIVKATFDHLADEEVAAGEYMPGDAPDYPSFGFSTDSYEAVAKPFYGAWASFSTRKPFAWKDKYRLSDAPDRRVRRLMEKENKKIRDEAIRDFNDAVRFLVTFVRKRDPRYLPNTQTAAERQESLRNAAAAQAARSRAANKERLSAAFVPDWAQTRDEADAGAHFPESEEEDSEVEEIECVVCSKTFKSEKSFEAHERSKKHVKAVQQLRRQMREEDLDLSLHETPAATDRGTSVEDALEGAGEQPNIKPVKGNDEDPVESELRTEEAELSDTTSEPLGGDEYASRADVEKRLFADHNPLTGTGRYDASKPNPAEVSASLESLSLGDDNSEQQDDSRIPPKKVGKAKAKREKRAARQMAEATRAGKHTCGVCEDSFTSKTKLFAHIRDLDHAAPVAKPTADDKRKKR